MVNTAQRALSSSLTWVTRLVIVYVVIVAATILTLLALSVLAPDQATNEAWIHTLIVSVFAVLLPLRVRAARRESHRAQIAVGIIAIALLVVNVVEALIPGLFPQWMRIEMFGIAILMAGIAAFAWSNRT